uniref:S-acyltransferase n=1 Tax=Leersia perrieri TaxID=77586 RepID=A0A0D9W870_9ORYZ
MPCCGARDPYAGLRALSQPERHGRKPWRGVRVFVLLVHGLFLGVLFLLDPTLEGQIREGKWCEAEAVHNSIWFAGFTYLGTIPLYSYFLSRKKTGHFQKWKIKLCNESQQNRATKFTIHCTFIATTDDGSISSWNIQQELAGLSIPHNSLNLYLLVSYHSPQFEKFNVCYCIVLMCSGGGWSEIMWYIFEQTVLTAWTVALYIQFLRLDIGVSWWKFAIGIVLLVALILILVILLSLLIFHTYLALTNQTTYEIARRKRIPYLREVPSRVHPFSKGICRNLYSLCLSKQTGFSLEPVPPLEKPPTATGYKQSAMMR